MRLLTAICLLLTLSGCQEDTIIKNQNTQIRALINDNEQLKTQVSKLQSDLKIRTTPEANLADQLIKQQDLMKVELNKQQELYEKKLRDAAVQIDTLGSQVVTGELSELQNFIIEMRKNNHYFKTEISRLQGECVQLRTQLKSVENKKGCKCL